MMDHLSLYKGFGSFLILAFTSSSARCSTTRVILAMIFSLSLQRLSCSRKSYHWWQVGMIQLSQTAGYSPEGEPYIDVRFLVVEVDDLISQLRWHLGQALLLLTQYPQIEEEAKEGIVEH